MGGALMEIFYLLFFIFAVSLDSFAVGMALGLGKIKLNPVSYVVIGVVSFLLMVAALLFGSLLGDLLGEKWSRWLGGLILIVLGALTARANIYNKKSQPTIPSTSQEKIRQEGSFLKRLLGLLDNPLEADLDCSASIGFLESTLLALALALDAFAAGLGAALSGYPILLTASLAGLAAFVFLRTGYYLGCSLCNSWNCPLLKILPGLLLIALGLLKIWGV